MKIIYLHQYFCTPNMSGGTRSYEIAKRLVQRGHEVHVITSAREEGREQKGWHRTLEDGIHVHWISIPYSNYMGFFNRVSAFFSFAIQSFFKALEVKGDVVFATSTPLTIAIPGVLASKKLKIPLVFEVRDLWPEIPIAIGAIKNPVLKICALLLEKWAYKNSEAIIALSPGMKDGVVKKGYENEKVVVVPNSCDNDLFGVNASGIDDFYRMKPWAKNKKLVIYTGTFGKINGVTYLVDLASEMRKISEEVIFLLVGEGIEEDEVRLRAEELGLLGKTVFIEKKVRKSDIPLYFKYADLSVSLCIDLPELRANSANKFFDSFAARKPILINYGGWQAEIINKFDVGIVAWGKNLRDVAVEIKGFLEKKSNPKREENLRYLSEDIFSRDRLVAKVNNVIEGVVKNDYREIKKMSEENLY